MSEPIITRPPPQGRPADRLAAGIAGLALIGSLIATVWFFAGFFETDPEFRTSSSAFLLSLGLGAFAIIPSAICLRLTSSAWRNGFRAGHAWWTLLLMLPWVSLGLTLTLRAPVPVWAPLCAFTLSLLLVLWALISLWVERAGRNGSRP